MIDYISFDVDSATYNVLNDFDFDNYKFKIMTFEHDFYNGGSNKRELSRNIFTKKGYKLLCSDIGNDGDLFICNNPYEDWWINLDYCDNEKIKLLECNMKDWKYIREIIKNNL